MVEKAIPLSHLPVGRHARVSRILGQRDHVHRLEEIGLRNGVSVQMFRRGNPCIIRFGGSKLCLRADATLSVMVEQVETVPAGASPVPVPVS